MATKQKAVKAGKPQKKQAVATERKEQSRALSPFEEMDVLFERLSRGLMSRMGFPALGDIGWPFQAHAPRVDVIDREKDVVIRAEIPGVSKEDVSVSVTDNSVTIRGETHKETKGERGDYFHREISRGTFQRTLALPADVAGDKAKASFRDGVLELTLPKREKSSRRKIQID